MPVLGFAIVALETNALFADRGHLTWTWKKCVKMPQAQQAALIQINRQR